MTAHKQRKTMANFPPTVTELLDEFQDMQDWDERYDYIIDLGRELPPLDPALQTEDNLVQGCMSTVWLVTQIDSKPPHNIHIQADSDSIIVKGLIVILLSHYDGKAAKDILTADAIEMFGKLGLNQHLSPQRRNGLFSMVKRLKQLAADHTLD